ncbi:MAG: hypothetical protein RIR89_507 [Actinomycetota bacterium]|jgi:hypothetical protein
MGEETFVTGLVTLRIIQTEPETPMARFRFLDRLFGVGGPLSRVRKPIKLDEEYPEQINAWAQKLKTDVDRSTSDLEQLRGKYETKQPKKAPKKSEKPAPKKKK